MLSRVEYFSKKGYISVSEKEVIVVDKVKTF